MSNASLKSKNSCFDLLNSRIGYVEYESEEAAKEAADEYKGEKEVIGSVFVQFVKENVNGKTSFILTLTTIDMSASTSSTFLLS